MFGRVSPKTESCKIAAARSRKQPTKRLSLPRLLVLVMSLLASLAAALIGSTAVRPTLDYMNLDVSSYTVGMIGSLDHVFA